MRVLLGWLGWGVGIVAQLVALHYALKLIGQSILYLVAIYS